MCICLPLYQTDINMKDQWNRQSFTFQTHLNKNPPKHLWLPVRNYWKLRGWCVVEFMETSVKIIAVDVPRGCYFKDEMFEGFNCCLWVAVGLRVVWWCDERNSNLRIAKHVDDPGCSRVTSTVVDHRPSVESVSYNENLTFGVSRQSRCGDYRLAYNSGWTNTCGSGKCCGIRCGDSWRL